MVLTLSQHQLDPPTLEYIVATEKVYNQLTQGKVEELRGEVKALLRRDHKVKPNIPKDEYKVLREIKKDNTRQILTADKGVCTYATGHIGTVKTITAKSVLLTSLDSNYRGVKDPDPTNK